VGRREPERGERDWSTTDGRTGADSKNHPDPEVVARAKRRRFTGEYKQRILAEVGPGQRLRRDRESALMRRVVLFVVGDLAAGARSRRLAGIDSAKARLKSKRDPVAEESQQLRRETQRLTEELRKAEIVIDIKRK